MVTAKGCNKNVLVSLTQNMRKLPQEWYRSQSNSLERKSIMGEESLHHERLFVHVPTGTNDKSRALTAIRWQCHHEA